MNVKFTELDNDKLANVLLKTPLVALKAGHKHLKSTLKDYVFPSEDELEVQYVKDIFTLTTEEIIEKWYGGSENAYTILSNLKKV